MKIRRKTELLEAKQLSADNFDEVIEWSGGKVLGPWGISVPTGEDSTGVIIGQWVVKRGEGDFYRISASMFDKLYEICSPTSKGSVQ